MKITPFVAAAAFALFAASVSLSAACTSSNASSTGSDPASSYCTALSTYVSTCKLTDPCTVASAQTCTQYVSAFSPAALTAFNNCTTSLTCGDAGTNAASLCIAAQEAEISPSGAQRQLATDYCAGCASDFGEDPPTCEQDFYAQLTTGNTNEAGFSASSADVGNAFLELNDTIIGQVDKSCALAPHADAGLFGCTAGFEVCAGAIVDTAVKTPAACQSQTPQGNVDGG